MTNNKLPDAIREELDYRIRNEKYRYYVPIGKVERFLNKLYSDKYIVGALLAANGIGKTTAMVNTLAHMMFPIGSEFFQQPLLLNWKYPKRGRIVSDPTTIRETIVPALQEWFPKDRYTTLNQGKNYPAKWKTDNGWEFDLMTFDQDPKEFESSTLGFCFFDEPPPHAIYKASIARLRKGGFCGIFATPLFGSAWLYDEVVANPNAERDYRFYMEAEVEDACVIHGERGFLDHDIIVKMVAQYTDEEMTSRVFGKFQHLVGLIFKSFNEEVHIINPIEINKRDWCVYCSWDTHPRMPEAIVWIAVNRQGLKVVVDELWSDDPTPELIERFKKIDSKYRTVRYLIDPSAFIEDKRTGSCFANDLATKYNLPFEPGSKRRTDAVVAMKDALHYRIAGGEMLTKPDLLFTRLCPQSIWEMTHWQWQEWSGKTVDTKDKNPKPEDKGDHFIEAIGRIILEQPHFVDYLMDGESNTFEEDINLNPFDK